MSTRKKSRKLGARAPSSAAAAKQPRGERDWPRLLGEAVLIVLVIVVPIILHRYSRNLLDVKDFTLGLGVATGLGLVLLTSLARGRLSWVSVRLNALIGAYLVWALAGIIYSQYRFATVSEAARLATHVGLYWLVILSVREARQARRIIWAAMAAATPVCLYAFVQAAGRDPIAWNNSTTRVFSFLGNATYLAGYLVLLIPLAVSAGWPQHSEGSAQEPGRRRWLGWLLVALSLVIVGMMVVSLYLTISLSPTIGLGLGLALAALLALIRGGKRVLRIAIPLAAAGLVVLLVVGYIGYRRLSRTQQNRWKQVTHLKDPYGEERAMIQRVGLDIFRKQPLVGKAYGTYAVYALEQLAPSWYADLGKSTKTMLVPNYAHNEFIEVLAEMGVVGGALFTALILAAFVMAIRVSLRHPEPGWARLGLAITASMTAFMFQNLYGVTFRQTGTVTFFWLFLGLLAVAQARLPVAEEGAAAPRLREVKLKPLSAPALGVVGLGLAVLLGLLTWTALKPVISNRLVREAEAAAKQGRFETAARLTGRALELNPYSFQGYYIAAYAWGNLGNHERSLAANEKALALLPGNASVYYNTGVNYQELGRLEEARDAFKRAIELMPTAMSHHAAMAEVLIRMGRLDEALPYAQEAVRLEPVNPGARLLLADVHARRGELAAAAAQMEEAARLAPSDASVARQLAGLHYRMKNLSKAVEAAERWIELNPTTPEAYVILGIARYGQRNYPAARAAFQTAVELNPSGLEARLRLAYSYLHLKQFPQASEQLTWLVGRHPDTREGKIAARLLKARSRPPAGGGTGAPAGAAPSPR